MTLRPSSKREAVIEAARVLVNTAAVAIKFEGRQCFVLPADVLFALTAAVKSHDEFRARQLAAAGINPDGSTEEVDASKA